MAKQAPKKRSSSNKRKNTNHPQSAPISQGAKFSGATSLKYMLLGAIIFGLLVVLFLVPFNGKTPFSHFLGLFPKAEETEAQSQDAKPQGSAQKNAKPAGQAQKPVQKPTVAANVKTASPLETLKAEEEDALDKLIEEKTASAK